MTEKTRLADTSYAHTLVIESTHEYKVHGPYGSNFACTMVFDGLLDGLIPTV